MNLAHAVFSPSSKQASKLAENTATEVIKTEMGCVHERRSVEVPLAEASRYFGRYVRDVECDGLGRIVLTVKVPLERLGIDRCVAVSKAVSVHFAALAQTDAVKQRMAVSWEPEGRGMFPTFSGTVGVEAEDTASASFITLDGSYDPPLAIVGDAFDAIVGKHIARQTARNLLDEIAITMETAFTNEGVHNHAS
jgi:hypothetical protein